MYEKIVQLKLESLDGKKYFTDAADVETLFRLIQSVPSPKAELSNLFIENLMRQIREAIKNRQFKKLRMSWLD